MAQIKCTPEYLAALSSLVEPGEVLGKHGFLLRVLDREELRLKRRCAGCGKPMSRLIRKRPVQKDQNESVGDGVGKQDTMAAGQRLHAESQDVTHGNTPIAEAAAEPPEELKYRCRYHLGSLSRGTKLWTCCNKPSVPSTEPCGGAYEHIPQDQKLDELSDLYQSYGTPSIPPGGSNIRRAVALDCEMGQAANGDSVLIRVTLIDYFSGTVLIDSLVQPNVKMAHLNTAYSGVTWADMKQAKIDKKIFYGKSKARQAVWKYVGPDTLVVGHGLENDLRSLGWIHMCVVDSLVTELIRKKLKEEEEAKAAELLKAMVELEASGTIVAGRKDSHDAGSLTKMHSDTAAVSMKPKDGKSRRKPGILSLKTLAKSKLGRDIQNRGKAGHDSLEDALAARDLVHLNVLELMEGQ